MPYWGANVRHENYVIQAKIYGEADGASAPDELIEYISNLTNTVTLPIDGLAKFFAGKIATAYQGYPDALWVTVDVLTTGGSTFGETRIIKEPEDEYA